MCLYILYSACPSGFRPTSSSTEYLGLNSLQKPLKNQLCDDNLPLFLYLTQRNRFIEVFKPYSPKSSTRFRSVPSASRVLLITVSSSYSDSYSSSGTCSLILFLKHAKYARSSLDWIYSLQYRSHSCKALMIIGLALRMSKANSSISRSSVIHPTSRSLMLVIFFFCCLASWKKKGRTLLGKSSKRVFFFFNTCIELSSSLISWYSAFTKGKLR